MLNIPVSNAELIDKITILEVKYDNITDENKLVNIEKELDLLLSIYKNSHFYSCTLKYKEDLFYINHQLWALEAETRKINISDNQSKNKAHKANLAYKIHTYNDERAKIKYQINKVTESRIIEEKSYE